MLNRFQRFENKKKGEPKKMEVKNEKLTELEKKLEEKKAQRKREQQSAKITSSRQSANRTKYLITQKVSKYVTTFTDLRILLVKGITVW